MSKNSSAAALLKPPALIAGDKIGIVAPASAVEKSALEAGCERLRKLGHEPVYSPSIFDRDLYFAGSVERRARELEEMFRRDDVRAILCARGGYGCSYLLPHLDPAIVRKTPKIFIGYSDITVLLSWLLDRAGVVAFHGPMLAKDFAHEDGVDSSAWKSATSGQRSWDLDTSGCQSIIDGEAEGLLSGGCLSLLAASLGTPYAVETSGRILFIEDVATKPFQIDRMLLQLKLAGKLRDVRGIIFGQMLDCVQPGRQNYTLQEVLKRLLDDLGIPVASGLRSGHVSGSNLTLPFGVRARLRVEKSVQLTILEAATALPGVKQAPAVGRTR
jgi:muramoyltetrapeptide carboxypeptidase